MSDSTEQRSAKKGKLRDVPTSSSRGFSLVSVTLWLLIMAITGASVLEISTAAVQSGKNDHDKNRAFYVAHGAIDLAKFKLARGENPVLSNQYFIATNPSLGSFSTASNAAERTVEITAMVGEARSIQKVQAVFSADCLAMDGPGQISNHDEFLKIRDVTAKIICPAQKKVILERLKISWTGMTDDQTLSRVVMDGNVYFENLPPQPLTGLAIGPHEADINDIEIADFELHVFDEIRIDYPVGSGPTAPVAFQIQLFFADGSDSSFTVNW